MKIFHPQNVDSYGISRIFLYIYVVTAHKWFLSLINHIVVLLIDSIIEVYDQQKKHKKQKKNSKQNFYEKDLKIDCNIWIRGDQKDLLKERKRWKSFSYTVFFMSFNGRFMKICMMLNRSCIFSFQFCCSVEYSYMMGSGRNIILLSLNK